LGLGGLVILHPAALPPFLFLLLAIGHQFFHPLQDYSWTDKKLLIHMLVLLNAFLYLRAVGLFRERLLPSYLLFALSIHASHYFIPGIGKLRLDPAYPLHDELWAL